MAGFDKGQSTGIVKKKGVSQEKQYSEPQEPPNYLDRDAPKPLDKQLVFRVPAKKHREIKLLATKMEIPMKELMLLGYEEIRKQRDK